MIKETKKETKTTKTVHIELDEKTHRLIKAYAILQGVKMEDMLKKGMEDYCKKLKKTFKSTLLEAADSLK